MPSQQIPTHIAIICDGNRRWAREHKLAVFAGHEHAVSNVIEPLVDRAQELGIKYLTFWVFGTDNWSRDPEEVAALMNLFRKFFDRQVADLDRKNVRVNMIGNLRDFAPDIQQRIKAGVDKTRHNTGITVTLAMSYGGRDELTRATRAIAEQVKLGELDPALITKQTIAKQLDTHDLPDPDLIVRTSGEQRLSGFLMWQGEYAELMFPQFHFPQFTPERLDEALAEFSRRQRRFGK